MAPRVPLLVVSLASLAAVSLMAQQAPPVFRSGVDLRQFEVSVLDKNRQPVRGLTAADFTVKDDGKPQKIVNFSAVEVAPSPPAPAVAWIREVAPDVQTNHDAGRADGRLFLILLDDALIPGDPAFTRSAKAIARRVIDGVSPADRVAVVFSAGSGGTQGFTSDRASLLAAVETLHPGYAVYNLGWNTAKPPDPPGAPPSPDPPGPVTDPDTPYRMASLRTLQLASEGLATAPQRRKVLVYVTPGLIADRSSAAAPTLARRGVRLRLKEENDALVRELRNVYDQLNAANVNLYVVDPCGLGGLERYVFGVLSQIPMLRGVSQPPPQGFDWLAPTVPPPPGFLARQVSGFSHDFALEAAANTGGFAIADTNDFGPGLDRMFAENSSYYVIAYELPAKHKPGSQHRLQVNVNRGDARVRVRSTYALPTAPKASKEEQPPELAHAIAGPVASAEMPLRVAVAPVAGPKGAITTVVVGLEHPPVTQETSEVFTIQWSVFTPDGRARGTQSFTMALKLQPTTGDAPVPYELLFPVDVPSGRHELRIAVHRRSDRVAGSVYANVGVPDFAAAPLSLSGVFVDATPSPAGGPFSKFSSLVPAVPTTRREFDQTDQAYAFVRIYQGGKDALTTAAVHTRLVNQDDAAIVDTSEAYAPGRFDATTRTADVRFPLPLPKLAAGEYLLTFEVTAGNATARRAVRLAVRK